MPQLKVLFFPALLDDWGREKSEVVLPAFSSFISTLPPSPHSPRFLYISHRHFPVALILSNVPLSLMIAKVKTSFVSPRHHSCTP